MIGKTARCRKQRTLTFQRHRPYQHIFRLPALTKRGGQAPCSPKTGGASQCCGILGGSNRACAARMGSKGGTNMFTATIFGILCLGLLAFFLYLAVLAIQALKTYIRRNGR